MSNEFKLVPVEATEAMTLAACDSYFDSDSSAWTAMAGAYRAMLAAAPQPPALGGELETRLLEEMSTRFELHRSDDNWLCVDDTQLGVEFAAEFFRPHLAPLQAEIELLRYKAELYDEVWELATGLGYMNVTTAVGELRKERDQLKARTAELEAALKFYADREHFHFESGNWDTVSGEPLNILWCGDEPDFVEDGTVARAALNPDKGSNDEAGGETV